MKTRILSTMLFLSALSLLGGCVNDTPPKPDGKFELGEQREIFSVVLGTGQVNYQIDTGQNAGFRIRSLAGAYPSDQTIHFSTTQITKNTFGEDVSPATPLFTYDANGLFAGANILITIPLAIPIDKFAMGFYYDKNTHELEGLPIDNEDEKGIIVVLRKPGDFFISMISKNKLNENISSDFQPGVDDWDMVNEGTLMNPAGTFSGFALTELWYYYTNTIRGKHHLWGSYNSEADTMQTIWYDNAQGILLAAQTESRFGWMQNYKQITDGIYYGITDINKYLFAYSMRVTKRPQLAALIDDKLFSLPLVVYRIDNGLLYLADPNYPASTKQTMLVADKATPAYHAARSVGALGTKSEYLFRNCAYLGVSALIDFAKITSCSDSAGALLKSDAYSANVTVTTPGYTLEQFNGQNYSLADSITVKLPNDTDRFFIYKNGKLLTNNSNGMYPLYSGKNTFGFCKKRKGIKPDTSLWAGWSTYDIFHDPQVVLVPLVDSGYIGDDIKFFAKTIYPPGSNLQYEWDPGDGRGVITTVADTVTINYDKTGIFNVKVTVRDLKTGAKTTTQTLPATILTYLFRISGSNLILGQPQLPVFITEPMHSAKRHLRYEWDFGDGSSSQGQIDTAIISHSYKKTGTFKVTLRVYVNSTGQFFGGTDTSVNIANSVILDVSLLKSMKFVKVVFYGVIRIDTTHDLYSTIKGKMIFSQIYEESGATSDTAPNRIIWNGNVFSSSFGSSKSSFDRWGNGDESTSGTSVSGEILSDGGKLVSIKGNSFYNYHSASGREPPASIPSDDYSGQSSALEFIDISLSHVSKDTIVFFANGPLLQTLAKNISWHNGWSHDSHGVHPRYAEDYAATDWWSLVEQPRLIVTFYK
jgi:hypothetical protein